MTQMRDTTRLTREALEELTSAAEAYIGPLPLELLARRDAGEPFIGTCTPEGWVRFLEALRDAKKVLDPQEPGSADLKIGYVGCPECRRPLNGYRGPLCRYCDPEADCE